MRKILGFGLAALLIFSFSIVVLAAEKQEEKGIERSFTVTVTAGVESVDIENRTISLKDARGNVTTFSVGEEVENLPQVKAGDMVEIEYHEAIAVRIAGPEDAPRSEITVATKAEPGEKPAGSFSSQVTVIASIEAVDKEDQTLTLKDPDGQIVIVKVRDAEKLKKVKPGDKLLVAYTRAMAISVKTVKK